MPTTSMRVVLAMLAAGLGLAACSAHSAAPAGLQQHADALHASAAQRIELAPTPDAALSATPVTVSPGQIVAEAPEEVHLPDGTVGVKVAKQYFHTIVVCKQRDGSFSTQCPAAPESVR